MGYFKNLAIEAEEAKLPPATPLDCFDMAREDCPQCGGIGYTIESSEDGEVMLGCFRCYVASHELDARIPTLHMRNSVTYLEPTPKVEDII